LLRGGLNQIVFAERRACASYAEEDENRCEAKKAGLGGSPA